MAKYIVNNSRFRPLEFQEMLTPVLAADEAYREYESQLMDLDAQASIWENLANSAIDQDTYNMYKGFSDEVKVASESLASEGLTLQSRSSLNKLRLRYSLNIVPIEQSYAARAEQAKAQLELMNRDPNIRFDRLASQTSLSSYIDNPQLNYRAVSGTQLMAQVSAQAQALLNEIRNNEAEYKSILGNQYYELVVRLGIDPNDIARAIADPNNANPLLTGIVNNVMASAGVDSFGELARNELRNMAAQGLYAGVGKTDIKTLSNDKWRMDYQLALQKDLLSFKARMESPQPTTTTNRPYTNIPRATSNAPVIKAYGGERLQKAMLNLQEWATTNKYNISEAEVLERMKAREDRGVYPNLSNYVKPSGKIAGVYDHPSTKMLDETGSKKVINGQYHVQDKQGNWVSTGEPALAGISNRDRLLNELADSFNLYGVESMQDLYSATLEASSMTAYVLNDIGLLLTDNSTAIKVLESEINQSYGGGSRSIRKINRHGAVGKSLSEKDALELINSSGRKDIKYDTSLDEFVLVVDMVPYVIDGLLILSGDDPSGLFQRLKAVNPSRIPLEKEDGTMKTFSEYSNEFLLYSKAYDYYARESENSLASRYSGYFNNAPKAQGIRGED